MPVQVYVYVVYIMQTFFSATENLLFAGRACRRAYFIVERSEWFNVDCRNSILHNINVCRWYFITVHVNLAACTMACL